MEEGETRLCATGEGLREGAERDQELRLAIAFVMRVETIGDDEVIDGVKKNVLCCAMSEMPFGEGMRGKSVCLLTSEAWGGVSVIMVFSDRRWRHA